MVGELTWIREVLADFTPGAAGIWTLVIMGAAYLAREWRENRKLSAEDRLARREGYEKQVAHLTAENRALAQDMKQLREEYDRYRRLCQEETDQLRQHIISIEHELSGAKRRMDTQAIQMIGKEDKK